MPGCAWALVSEERPAAFTEAASPPATAAPLRNSRRPSSVLSIRVLPVRRLGACRCKLPGRRPTANRLVFRFERRLCRRNLLDTRLGRRGPSPATSCGSHCVLGGRFGRGAEPPSEFLNGPPAGGTGASAPPGGAPGSPPAPLPRRSARRP